jgi:hypothetical protein
MEKPPKENRLSEWFVPQFGPTQFRIAVGLLFLPYTCMVLSYTVIGSMLAPVIYWDRVVAIVAIYFFGLGIAAHALDAIGGTSGEKPWGTYFSKKRLWVIAAIALIAAYGIGIYYIVTATPWLLMIALMEGFFLFAYNLELFDGRFHTDGWFAFSWGVLPVLAGTVLQTNALTIPACIFAGAMGLISLSEINASRPYKALKKSGESPAHQGRYEMILKSLSLSVILIAVGMVLWRKSH